VIVEYKSPGKFESKVEFEKAKEQVREYIKEEAKTEPNYGRYYGVVTDGYRIAFLRYRRKLWEDPEEPLPVNPQTMLRLLESIRGLRRKPIDAEFL
jgi:DNA-binding SARP family transcriptional activator